MTTVEEPSYEVCKVPPPEKERLIEVEIDTTKVLLLVRTSNDGVVEVEVSPDVVREKDMDTRWTGSTPVMRNTNTSET